MTGRWTIRRRNGGIDGNDALLDDTAARSANDWIPVVPCDDAAIERAHNAMRECAGRYLTDRQIVGLVLRAAGESS